MNDQDKEFIVIALADSEPPTLRDCKIIDKDSAYPAIYKQVYGPTPHKDCKKFIEENCKRNKK